ncbi:MAG: hypothetical protein FJX76_23985 [Armatimonadetes bacterium]|nr:hypothetical protein [Armatimonadota bacterium]
MPNSIDDRTLALACLFYGFIVVVIGVVSFLVPRKVSDARVRESLWLLGTFGLLHGMRAWLQVVEILAPPDYPDKTLFLLNFVAYGLNIMALLCLAQFTAEIVAVLRRGLDWMRWMPLAGLAAYMSSTFGPFLAQRLGWMVARVPAAGLDVWTSWL